MTQCNPKNYKQGRAAKIAYIVMHFTANNGDTAQGNANYFARTAVGASAHYFVDKSGVVQSVPESDTAYHCGAKQYKHATCRNANSVGVEMCSQIVGGEYVIMPDTVNNAVRLVKSLVGRYHIDRRHILRHYDVTGKNCPAPWVSHPEQFELFLDRVFAAEGEIDMTYNDVQAIVTAEVNKALADRDSMVAQSYGKVSSWAQAAWDKCTAEGLFDGTRPGAPLTREQAAVVLCRMKEGKE